jgi:hypothetical protein
MRRSIVNDLPVLNTAPLARSVPSYLKIAACARRFLVFEISSLTSRAAVAVAENRKPRWIARVDRRDG